MDLGRDSDYFLNLQTETGWGRMLDSFARWCAPKPGSLVLDVGCGPGLLPALFARDGAVVYGCDHDAAMLADPLCSDLLLADGGWLPFSGNLFDLTAASNLLFLHRRPQRLLAEMARVTCPGGQVCLLNPSEAMSVVAASDLADQNRLEGLARETLLNYARRAEKFARWMPDELAGMYAQAGLQLTDTTTRMGPGLVRYAKGIKNHPGNNGFNKAKTE